jgi:hypothetical protein
MGENRRRQAEISFGQSWVGEPRPIKSIFSRKQGCNLLKRGDFMVDVANRYSENAPGRFYVDDQCIDCDFVPANRPNELHARRRARLFICLQTATNAGRRKPVPGGNAELSGGSDRRRWGCWLRNRRLNRRLCKASPDSSLSIYHVVPHPLWSS